MTLLADLHTLFGYEQFRPCQREAIDLLLAGHDVLCILPTGGGKSLTYQMTARLLHAQGRGVTVVVSPLIALMKDQADALAARGWDCVGVLNSHIPASEQEATMRRLHAGELCLLYVTPERLERPDFVQALQQARVGLLAVDEAHCVSQWGNDFRPAFLRLDEAVYTLREAQAQPVPVLALTATAPPLVRQDIEATLRLREPKVLICGFERDNLDLAVEHIAEEEDKWATLARYLGPDADEATRLQPPGIVYSATVRDTEPVAAQLAAWGWRAAAYHGQMDKASRQTVQEAFMAGELDVVVATNAFGLGIDKRDLHFVLHWHLPGSPEAYYQEAGRAGRDGQPARCVLFYYPNDRHLQAFFAASGGPDEEDVRALWVELGRLYAGEPLRVAALAAALDATPGEVERLLPPLEESGYLALEEDGRLRVRRIVPPDELELPMTDAAQRHAQDQSRLKMMEAYALTTDCRHEFLLNYLGQRFDTDDCGHCDNCRSGSSVRQSDLDLPFAPGEAVRHPAWGLGRVQRLEGKEGVTVLFDDVGYKTIALAVWAENPALLERVG